MSIEDFVKAWGYCNIENLRNVRTNMTDITSNHYTLNISEYDNTTWVQLYLKIDNRIYPCGFVSLSDIDEVIMLDESIS